MIVKLYVTKANYWCKQTCVPDHYSMRQVNHIFAPTRSDLMVVIFGAVLPDIIHPDYIKKNNIKLDYFDSTLRDVNRITRLLGIKYEYKRFDYKTDSIDFNNKNLETLKNKEFVVEGVLTLDFTNVNTSVLIQRKHIPYSPDWDIKYTPNLFNNECNILLFDKRNICI